MGIQEMEKEVRIQMGTIVLEGELGLPLGTNGLVVFAHGS